MTQGSRALPGSHFLILVVSVTLLASCEPSGGSTRRSEEHMGTLVTITVRASGRRASEAISAAFAAFGRVDRALTTYDDDSEIGRLNRDGVLEKPSVMVADNVKASLTYSRLTDGSFDITVLPVLRLYERAFAEGREPSAPEIAEVRRLVDYRTVVMLGDKIELAPGQKITLGGIAKGYAVDLAIEALIAKGIKRAIVEAGGDLRVLGRKTDQQEWHIAIRNPRDSEDFIARLEIEDRAVVTSGDYERFFDADRTLHHIIDPTTGRSATELISVSLISRTAFEGDALSTAAFVMGPVQGLALIESLDDVEGLFITRSRRVIRSSGFGRYEVVD